MRNLLLGCLLSLGICVTALADDSKPFIIHGIEVGVGKFHRMDNKNHPYAADSAWFDYVMPASADGSKSMIVNNADGSVSIFFTNLTDLLSDVSATAQKANRKIDIFNLEAHGMPGGMWYPASAAQRTSAQCSDWLQASTGDDQGNYDQYYSAIPKEDILYYRQYAKNANHGHQDCTSALTEWQQAIQATPGFAALFSDNAQVHFISCIVGMGAAGDAFTKGIAAALFANTHGSVVTSTYYGLGDWSIPEGMGFWDYQNAQQLKHDNSIYPVDHSDREIAQQGIVRLANNSAGAAQSALVSNIMFMNIDQPLTPASNTTAIFRASHEVSQVVDRNGLPQHVRIPGTNAYVDLTK